MNKNKLRWAVYRELRKRDVIYARRGGYSVKNLCEFIISLREFPMGNFICEDDIDCEQKLTAFLTFLNRYGDY